MDSHVQEILVWLCLSINLLSPRAQEYKKQYLASQHKEDKDTLETVQQWATMMIKRLEHLSYKEGLKELGLFSIKKEGLRGVLSMCMKNGGGQHAVKEAETDCS